MGQGKTVRGGKRELVEHAETFSDERPSEVDNKMARPALEKQIRHRGTVVFVHDEENRTYGFIAPEGQANDRAKNIWFGNASLAGQSVQRGDGVEYVLTTLKHRDTSRKNLSAFRVWVRDPASHQSDDNAITTHYGEDET